MSEEPPQNVLDDCKKTRFVTLLLNYWESNIRNEITHVHVNINMRPIKVCSLCAAMCDEHLKTRARELYLSVG